MRFARVRVWIAAVVAAAVLAVSLSLALIELGERAAAAPAKPRPPATRANVKLKPPTHIAVILLENKEYPSVIGSRRAPFLNALARRHVLLTHDFAVSHPSLPNYLALTSGSTFGITSDCISCLFAGRNIIDQLSTHHMSWKAYMQGLPSPCFKGAEAGSFPHLYAAKHDPFIHYIDVRSRPARCHRIVPFPQLGVDLAQNRLPRFAFISPDECFDMHSCSINVGDTWLATWVPRILHRLGPNGLMIVVFDEGSSRVGCCTPGIHGGHVAAVIAGPGAKHRVRITTAFDHYSVLRLIEDAWGFQRLRHAADRSTRSILGWRPAP
jgi:phosphatidylinositol-3-phosphatase